MYSGKYCLKYSFISNSQISSNLSLTIKQDKTPLSFNNATEDFTKSNLFNTTSISPSSTRNPFILTCLSFLPKNSISPEVKILAISPVL